MPNVTLYSLIVLRNAIFHFKIYYLEESVSSEDVNPDFVHQSNEINEIIVLCFGKCSAAKNVLNSPPW